MTDDTPESEPEEPRTISVDIPVDRHRAAMFDELTDVLNEDEARDIVASNLTDTTEKVVTEVYDNRDQIAAKRQEFAANAEGGE